MCVEALTEAVDLAGGQSGLRNLVNQAIDELDQLGFYRREKRPKNISQQHIWDWLNKAKNPVPPSQYVIPIERAVNVSRYQLRSDIYGIPEGGIAA